MSLEIQIQRVAGNDTQVQCSIDGNIIREVYSFNEIDYTDTLIDSLVRQDLINKGYAF